MISTLLAGWTWEGAVHVGLKEIEHGIKKDLIRVRDQIRSGDDSEIAVWAMDDELACSQRPLRDHPHFGGPRPRPLPREARSLVVGWVERVKEEMKIRSIICLLEDKQLDRHYVRGGLDLHEGGLLGYYEAQGLEVRHFPMTDYQRPSENSMRTILETFNELPKPVLLHCSAAIDRTTPVAAFIVQQRREGHLEHTKERRE